MELVRINDEVVTASDFIKLLKFGGRFDSLIEEMVREKLTVHVARKAGMTVSEEEVQARADQIRRVKGLHRAVDMNRWLDGLGITVEDLEQFIIDMLLFEKIQASIATDSDVEEHFALHSPEFDSLTISHIIVDNAGKAREIVAIAGDAPEMFSELAKEHSIADTASEGGYIGMVMRGNLPSDIESRVFHADEGEVIGPFESPDGTHYELFMINSKRKGVLDDHTADEIRRKLKDEWIMARAGENRVEIC